MGYGYKFTKVVLHSRIVNKLYAEEKNRVPCILTKKPVL